MHSIRWIDRSLGLEIAPKVRFAKKGQPKTDAEATVTEENDGNAQEATKDEEDNDDNWFKVKEKSDTLEQVTLDSLELPTKEKKLSKAKLAKKLRKKNVLINTRVAYDEDGNVRVPRIVSFKTLRIVSSTIACSEF